MPIVPILVALGIFLLAPDDEAPAKEKAASKNKKAEKEDEE